MSEQTRPTPRTDRFKQDWPDSKRHNWPCTFESEAFEKLEELERESDARAEEIKKTERMIFNANHRASVMDEQVVSLQVALKTSNERIKELETVTFDLSAENAKFREALERAANDLEYCIELVGEVANSGEIAARQALAGKEEG